MAARTSTELQRTVHQSPFEWRTTNATDYSLDRFFRDIAIENCFLDVLLHLIRVERHRLIFHDVLRYSEETAQHPVDRRSEETKEGEEKGNADSAFSGALRYHLATRWKADRLCSPVRAVSAELTPGRFSTCSGSLSPYQ